MGYKLSSFLSAIYGSINVYYISLRRKLIGQACPNYFGHYPGMTNKTVIKYRNTIRKPEFWIQILKPCSDNCCWSSIFYQRAQTHLQREHIYSTVKISLQNASSRNVWEKDGFKCLIKYVTSHQSRRIYHSHACAFMQTNSCLDRIYSKKNIFFLLFLSPSHTHSKICSLPLPLYLYLLV